MSSTAELASTEGTGTSTGSTPDGDKLRWDVAIGWAIGSTGTAALLGVVNALILKYVVDYLLISAGIAGAIITATRLFDAAIDPFMGTISDRTRSRWGRRRPYLFIGAVLCALSPVIIFSDPLGIALLMPVVYMTVGLVFFSIASTVFSVPYITMSFELTESPAQRTLLMSYRVYALSAGGILAQAFAPWVVTAAGDSMSGFAVMGWAMAAIIGTTCMLSFAMTRHARAVVLKETEAIPRLRDMGQAFRNGPFVALILAKSTYLLGAGVQSAALAFFITVVLERSLAVLGLIASVLLGCVILSQPFWVWVCNRIGKRRCFIFAAPINGLAVLSWLLAGPGEPDWAIAARAVAIGLAGGGMTLAIQAMLPDTLQHESDRGGVSQQGALAGVFTTIERGVSAFSVAIAGAILSIGGYVGGARLQSESAINALYASVSVVPFIGIVLGMILMRGYKLNH